MFGTFVRALYALGIGALFTALLGFVLATFIPLMESGAEDVPEEAQADMVIGYFSSVEVWFALVVLFSVAMLVIGRAVLENRAGGVR